MVRCAEGTEAGAVSIREELLRPKWKSGEYLKQAMTVMFGGHADLLLKTVVTGWRDELAGLKQERMMMQLREENLRLTGKGDESLRRAMRMTMGGQASVVIKEAFVGWHDVLKELKQERYRTEFEV